MKKLAIVWCWGVLLVFAIPSYAAVPLLLNYQGNVKDNTGSPVNGDGHFKFAIVNSAGDTSYWSNDSTSAGGSEPTASVAIPVSNGLFTVKLGDVTITTGTMHALTSSTFNNPEIYLRVWFSVDGSTYELLTPDTQIVSSGFSIKAPGWTVSGNNMYSDVTGNVGIGTSTPLAKLHILNAGYPMIESTGTGPFGFILRNPNRDWYILHSNGTAESGSLTIYDGTASQSRLHITLAGNVGIGTNTPAGKLDVNGSIYQRGGVLHADYVFEPGFKLESIEDHAEYMWAEKHLKAIPKAMKDENGNEIVEVGAHRRGIVEELEKAHIYIEQLNSHIKVLEERLAKMEKADK